MRDALGQRTVYSLNRPEVHDVLRRWRALGAGRDPEPLLLGETVRARPRARSCPFYGDDDELQLAFNFLFVHAALDADAAARRSSSGSRPCCPTARGRSGRAPTTTSSASRPAGRAATRAARSASR